MNRITQAAVAAKLEGYTHMSSIVKNHKSTTYHHVVDIDRIIDAGHWIPSHRVTFASGAHARYGNHTSATLRGLKCINKSDAINRFAPVPQFFAEITDTFGGEANYCWVHRYLIDAKTFSGAVRKLTQETGYHFRKAYDTGDSRRYNVSRACICAFIQWSDPSDREYSCLKTL